MKVADLRIAHIDPRTPSFARENIPLRNDPDSQNTSHQPRSSVASRGGFYRGDSPGQSPAKNCIKTFNGSFISKEA